LRAANIVSNNKKRMKNITLWNSCFPSDDRNNLQATSVFRPHMILLCNMSLKQLLFLILVGFISTNSLAQRGFALDGYVKDRATGDVISGARISISNRGTEAYSNRYGYYSISVPVQDAQVVVDYHGFVSDTLNLYVEDNVRHNFVLDHHTVFGQTTFEVTTSSQSTTTDPLSSKIDVPVGTLQQIPYLFSENDVVKGLQMFPGVDFSTEGSSDLIVRGGEVGQNLMLFDGTPVYSQGHFTGYISNFNTGLINNIQLYKGAFPARYGGRVSSVIDITSVAGSDSSVMGSLTISPILANLNVGMPLDKKGSSIAINVRRSYIDILLSPALGGNQFSFGDFHTKMKFNLSERDVFSISYFNLNDKLGVTFESGDSSSNVLYDLAIQEVNRTTTLRWNRNHNSQLFSSVSTSYTGFTHNQNQIENNLNPLPGNPARVHNDIKFYMGDVSANTDFEYNHSNKHFLRFGLQNTVHLFLPGKLNERVFSQTNILTSDENFGDTVLRKSAEIGLYIEDDWRVNDVLKINAGLRTVIYAHKDKFGVYPEPRISGRYMLDEKSSLKFSYMRANQFLHLYNNGSTDLEVIVWIPATDVLKPANSNQLTFGYTSKIKKNMEWQADAYFKTLGNQLLFYTIDYFDQEVFERNAISGKGTAYGIENYLKVSTEELSAWLSYDLSVSKRTFEALNRGESFFHDYDRRHTFKGNFVLNLERWILSLNTIVSAGNPYTLPNAKYRDLDGRLILSYDEINNYRSNTYFRTDVRFQYFWGIYDEFNHSIELTLYNISGNKNASYIYSELDRDFPNQKYKALKESNFLVMPSISYKLTI